VEDEFVCGRAGSREVGVTGRPSRFRLNCARETLNGSSRKKHFDTDDVLHNDIFGDKSAGSG
jgi:hypothetical protein